jgi:hypothetical protein
VLIKTVFNGLLVEAYEVYDVLYQLVEANSATIT